MRGTIAATFIAGGMVGQVLGVGLGGAVAAQWGWRAAFAIIGFAGLVIALVFPFVARPARIVATSKAMGLYQADVPRIDSASLRPLLQGRTLISTYLAGGLQLYMLGALPAWLPSFFNRYHHLPLAQASGLTAGLLFISGLGMISCGAMSDRFGGEMIERRTKIAAAFCLFCALGLGAAFSLPAGLAQLVALGFAMFFVAGTIGPCSAIVADLTPIGLRATAMAVLALAYSVLGLAPGPIITGRLADSIGLLAAFQAMPLIGGVAALVFLFASSGQRRTAAP